MKLHHKIKRDEKLVKERVKLAEENESLNDNMIIIYIDALARPRAHLKLPKVMQFFKE